jgi:hypothetical protein
MSKHIITKSEALETIDFAVFGLQRAINSSAKIEEKDGIHEAFYEVAKCLPTLHSAYQAIQVNLDTFDETAAQAQDEFKLVIVAGKACEKDSRYISALYEAVRQGGSSVQEKYRAAVVKDRTIEKVMVDLLEAAIKICQGSLVSPEQHQSLKDTLQHIKAIPESLELSPRSYNNIANYGDGTQWNHLGTGHQNYSTGGVMVTGNNDNAQYNFHSEQPGTARPRKENLDGF